MPLYFIKLKSAVSQLTEDPRTGEISWHNHATISPRLTEVLDKMVRYDFRQRYESAVEALQAVNNLGHQVSPTTISSSPRITIDYNGLFSRYYADLQ